MYDECDNRRFLSSSLATISYLPLPTIVSFNLDCPNLTRFYHSILLLISLVPHSKPYERLLSIKQKLLKMYSNWPNQIIPILIGYYIIHLIWLIENHQTMADESINVVRIKPLQKKLI